MSAVITVELNGIAVPVEFDSAAIAAIAAALPKADALLISPLMSVPEAAAFLRCKRQRVDDLLSTGRLGRVKEGTRTLIRRSDLERHLVESTNRHSR